MIQGIEHIAILAKNTAALKDWYVKMFDFRIISDNGKGIYFIAAPGGSMIEIVPTDVDGGVLGDKVSGFRHIAFTVDNFEETVENLTAANIEAVSGPTVTASGAKLFFFRDPEGNILQLINRPEPLL